MARRADAIGIFHRKQHANVERLAFKDDVPDAARLIGGINHGKDGGIAFVQQTGPADFGHDLLRFDLEAQIHGIDAGAAARGLRRGDDIGRIGDRARQITVAACWAGITICCARQLPLWSCPTML